MLEFRKSTLSVGGTHTPVDMKVPDASFRETFGQSVEGVSPGGKNETGVISCQSLHKIDMILNLHVPFTASCILLDIVRHGGDL